MALAVGDRDRGLLLDEVEGNVIVVVHASEVEGSVAVLIDIVDVLDRLVEDDLDDVETSCLDGKVQEGLAVVETAFEKRLVLLDGLLDVRDTALHQERREVGDGALDGVWIEFLGGRTQAGHTQTC